MGWALVCVGFLRSKIIIDKVSMTLCSCELMNGLQYGRRESLFRIFFDLSFVLVGADINPCDVMFDQNFD